MWLRNPLPSAATVVEVQLQTGRLQWPAVVIALNVQQGFAEALQKQVLMQFPVLNLKLVLFSFLDFASVSTKSLKSDNKALSLLKYCPVNEVILH